MTDFLATMLLGAIPIAVLLVIAALEWRYPAYAAPRRRWIANLGLGALNVVIVRIAKAGIGIPVAAWLVPAGFGLLPLLALPGWLGIIAFVVIMDGAIYWQHRAMHATAWGWALHRLHHADPAFDVTTGVRFHPGEAAVSLVYKAALIILLGATPLAVVVFELYLAVSSMAEHANIRLPAAIDRRLRLVWVTPAMHRIHHGAHGDDHRHNYGFALSIWDRLFKTTRDRPGGTTIGLPPTSAAD